MNKELNKEINKVLDEVNSIGEKYNAEIAAYVDKREKLIKQLEEYTGDKNPRAVRMVKAIKMKLDKVSDEIELLNAEKDFTIDKLNISKLIQDTQSSNEVSKIKHDSLREKYTNDLLKICREKMGDFYKETMVDKNEHVALMNKIKNTANKNSSSDYTYSGSFSPIVLFTPKFIHELYIIEQEMIEREYNYHR